MMRVLVLNGPNLNLLGTREPDVYGSATLPELMTSVASWAEDLGMEVEHLQTNHEGELIEAVHRSGHDGIVVNPGALTHTSRALADAVASVPQPVVEVHLSNIAEREPWRAHSVLSGVVVRSIYGRGPTGYRDALRHLANRAEMGLETVRYGPHPDHVGDLRRGVSGLVVLVHGGFWRHEWTRDTMESIAVDLTERGWSTWNIEYRRIGAGGGWPGSAHDVSMALDHARRLDAGVDGIVVVGHSAGGHLALWSSRRADGLSLVVALAPVTSLAGHAVSGLFGSDEARVLLESGAPTEVAPTDVPALLVHGDDDQLVPPDHSRRLAGRPGTEVVVVPGGHFELLDPGSEHWERVVATIRAH